MDKKKIKQIKKLGKNKTMLYREIAEVVGCSTGEISRILRRGHINKQRGPQNPERQLEMIQMRKEGMTLQEVADVFGISRERVRQIAGNSVKARSYMERNYPLLCDDSWLSNHAHLTNNEICEITGYPVSTVRAFRSGSRYALEGGTSAAKGVVAENIVGEKMESLGFGVEMMPYGQEFDILVNGKIRIDVKSAWKASENSNTENLINPLYKFSIGGKKKRKLCDFFVLHIASTELFFVVPSRETWNLNYSKLKFVYPHSGVGPISKWAKGEDRWDLIENWNDQTLAV